MSDSIKRLVNEANKAAFQPRTFDKDTLLPKRRFEIVIELDDGKKTRVTRRVQDDLQLGSVVNDIETGVRGKVVQRRLLF